jgi:Tfp pilus assembly protein PilF
MAGRLPRADRRDLVPTLLPALVGAATFFTFLPVLVNGFVNWDDPGMLLENPHHRGPWRDRLWGAWSQRVMGEYMPVTWMTYSLDRALWDLEAPGYHLTNLLLHVATAIAVYALARRLLAHALGPGRPDSDGPALEIGSAMAALAFALHPLRAEPVAWLSARDVVLGGLLFVLSVLCYVAGWDRRQTGRVPAWWLLGSAALFAASLLSRATAVVLPCVLVALDVYPLRRLRGGVRGWLGPGARGVWMEKAVHALIGALGVLMGFLARGDRPGDFLRAAWDPLIGVAWAVHTAASYLWHGVGISPLGPLYRMPSREDPMWGALALGVIALVAVSAIVVAAARRGWAGALTAWVVYLIVLVPTSGLVPFGRIRGASDRYTYVACIGWAIVAGGAAALGWRAWRSGGVSRGRALAVAALIVAVLGGWSVLTWRQVQVWQNGVPLWTRALEVYPGATVARNNLAVLLAARGDFQLAEGHFRAVTAAWPTSAGAFQNLGRTLVAQGKLPEALEAFRRAAELAPGSAAVRVDLGTALFHLGQLDDAVAQLERAVELAPGSARAHESLGTVLWRQGRKAEGARHLQRATALRSGMLGGDDLAAPPSGPAGGGGS